MLQNLLAIMLNGIRVKLEKYFLHTMSLAVLSVCLHGMAMCGIPGRIISSVLLYKNNANQAALACCLMLYDNPSSEQYICIANDMIELYFRTLLPPHIACFISLLLHRGPFICNKPSAA